MIIDMDNEQQIALFQQEVVAFLENVPVPRGDEVEYAAHAVHSILTSGVNLNQAYVAAVIQATQNRQVRDTVMFDLVTSEDEQVVAALHTLLLISMTAPDDYQAALLCVIAVVFMRLEDDKSADEAIDFAVRFDGEYSLAVMLKLLRSAGISSAAYLSDLIDMGREACITGNFR